MTGMGSDGAQGAKAIRAAGGRVIVQDEESSVIFGMAKAVITENAADEVVPLEKIPEKIIRIHRGMTMAKEFDLNKYSKLFVTEAREYLRTLNDSMVELEKRPEDKELIDQMFRACHTIKGMASMMNLASVTDTAHALEDVLGAIRDGQPQCDP